MKKLNIACIGLGKAGLRDFENVNKHFTLKAVCDIDEKVLNYLEESAAVRARRSVFSLSSKLQQHIFKWVFIPDWTINEFPAFANTRTLASILEEHPFYNSFI